MKNADYWIEKLSLTEHIEGGFFKEIYRSDEIIAKNHLPGRFNGNRSFSTSIYYLLKSDEFSAFHRVKQDELWHFYDGSSIILHVFDKEGNYQEKKLGKDFNQNEHFQAVVYAGEIFAASVAQKNSYALVGCTCAPGFDMDDFEFINSSDLLKINPNYEKIILKYSKAG